MNRKTKLIIFIGSLILGAAIAVLLGGLLAGPRLGPHYDYLLSYRSPPPAAREILLVETDDPPQAEEASGIVMTLTEFDAAALLMLVPAPSTVSVSAGSEAEMRNSLDEEYGLISRNVKTLFEAIRLGSVPPGEANHYLTTLLELTERGKERLARAIIRGEAEGQAAYNKAAALFGAVWQAGDLRLPGHKPDSPWYSKAAPDWDGKLRRVRPVNPDDDTAEIAYAALKGRYTDAGVVPGETGPALALRGGIGANRADLVIPLDQTGSILIEQPEEFRRLPVSLFYHYAEADRDLARLLKEGEAAGIYAETAPEISPLYLGEAERKARQEMLDTPSQSRKEAWLAARRAYMDSLQAFLDGPAEQHIAAGYDHLIEHLKLGEEGLGRLISMRDTLSGAFAHLRETWKAFTESRTALEKELGGAFCMVTPPGPVPAALMANTILTGRYLVPPRRYEPVILSLEILLVGLLCIAAAGPAAGLAIGLVLALGSAAGFSWLFITTGSWVDPLLAGGPLLAAALFSSAVKTVIRRRGRRRLEAAYRRHTGRKPLRILLQKGRPALHEQIKARATIVAVKNPRLPLLQDKADDAAAAEAAAFYEAAAAAIKKAGGVFLGCEGDTALLCFGSPLERLGRKDRGAPPEETAAIAVHFIGELKDTNTSAWRFGVDSGECMFMWTELSGFCAYGRPVVRARILAGLCGRCKARVLAGDTVRERIKLPARRAGSLGGQGGSDKEAFYEIEG